MTVPLGLIVGKFLPPHAGHDHLIRTARAQVDELVVVVAELEGQRPAATVRAAWLAEIHPDVTVRVVPDIGHDDDSEVWAEYTRSFLAGAPDVVFTSEAYGDAWAAALGCRHVCVDRERRAVPISATAIREAPSRGWRYLAPVVRAGLTRRIAVVGAESTGTTTLARALADRFATRWVPEYGREYSEVKMRGGDAEWRSDEFVHIALRQQDTEDAAARLAGPVLCCDTDAMATAVWHERYVGGVHPEVERLAAARTYDAYLLTSCDIPFVPDGLRDGEHVRPWMTRRFRERLADRDEPWIELCGDHASRVDAAVAFLGDVLGEQWLETSHVPAADVGEGVVG